MPTDPADSELVDSTGPRESTGRRWNRLNGFGFLTARTMNPWLFSTQ